MENLEVKISYSENRELTKVWILDGGRGELESTTKTAFFWLVNLSFLGTNETHSLYQKTDERIESNSNTDQLYTSYLMFFKYFWCINH